MLALIKKSGRWGNVIGNYRSGAGLIHVYKESKKMKNDAFE